MTSYRMLPRARLGLLLAGLALGLAGFFMVGFPGPAIGICVGGGLYLWSAGWGCTLEPSALVIDGLTKKRIDWADIQGVSYNISRLSTATTIIDAAGKVWMLRAPAHSSLAPDPLLRTKMTEIENFWKAHRGSGWREDLSISTKLPSWQRTA